MAEEIKAMNENSVPENKNTEGSFSVEELLKEQNALLKRQVELLEAQEVNLQADKKLQKKQLAASRIFACANIALVVVILIACIKILPGLMTTLTTVTNTLNVATSTMEQAQGLLANVDSALADLSGVASNVNTLVDESSVAINDTMKMVNAMDIEGLNRAIKDLGDAIEPMANFARIFSR